MSELFYTDPIAAAYMAREFGVEYIEEGYRIFDAGEDIDYDKANIYHIHPDSLHIFEPQEGDVIITIDDMVTEIDAGDVEHLRNIGAQRKIIQRNGKAFFMPEEDKDDDR